MELVKRGRSSSWPLMAMVVLMLVAHSEVKMGEGAQVSPSQCKEERQLGINYCKSLVFGQPASAACCHRIRVSNWECVCPAVDAKLAALIDINRAISILRGCGRRVPRNFKCGALNFP